MKRTIAAILAADVAGYSRLIAEDEDDTLRRFAEYSALYRGEVARFGGRVFNTAGDAILAEFPSAVEALRAAIAIQEQLRGLNLEHVPQRRLQFRMGLNIGDVVETDTGDMLGDGVNIAARLEGVAEPGGICVSRSVNEAIAARVAVTFRDLGPQRLKNIPRPVHAFRVVLPSDEADVAATGSRWRKWLPRAAALLLVIGLGGLAAYWFGGTTSDHEGAQLAGVKPRTERSDLLSVSVVHPQQACFRDQVWVSGTLVPRRQVDVGPETEGLRVLRVLAKPLDSVASGQLLAELGRPERPDQAAVQIRSPVAGVVSRANATIGAPTSFKAPPLFEITAQGELELAAEVPLKALATLAPKQPASITPLGLPEVEGQVRSVATAIDPQTQLGQTRILMRTRGNDLRRGQYARGVVTIAERCGLAVPASAIERSEQGNVVYVSNDGRIEGRTVETGLASGKLVEIRSGLDANDSVVPQAAAFIREGDTVRPIAVAGAAP